MATNPPAASQELVALKQKALTVRDFFVARKGEIAAALPKQIGVDRFLRICFNSMTKNPDLFGCTKESLYSAVMRSATLGLEPDDGRGLSYLIPRKDHGVLKANFQIGYKGLVDLARRSERGMTFEASVVYDKEPFRLVLGADSLLEHTPRPVSERGDKIIGAYAVAWIPGATRSQWRWLWLEEIEARRNRSQVPNGPAWKNDYAAMCCKTACIALARLLPANPEVAQAIEEDDQDDTMRGDAGDSFLDLDITPPAPAEPDKPAEPPLPTKTAEKPKEAETAGTTATKPAEVVVEPEDAMTATEAATEKPASGDGEPIDGETLKAIYAAAKKVNTKANNNMAAVALVEATTGKKNATTLNRKEATAVLEAFAKALAAEGA